MIDWSLDAGLQRQAQIGLSKGEAHHALKRAISFHRRGEIRDRSGEGQHYRIAGMNLLAAIIIFWNTRLRRGRGVRAAVPRGLPEVGRPFIQSPAMELGELVRASGVAAEIRGEDEVEIADLAYDSRRVGSGT